MDYSTDYYITWMFLYEGDKPRFQRLFIFISYLPPLPLDVQQTTQTPSLSYDHRCRRRHRGLCMLESRQLLLHSDSYDLYTGTGVSDFKLDRLSSRGKKLFWGFSQQLLSVCVGYIYILDTAVQSA
jgi:hypothetical protein